MYGWKKTREFLYTLYNEGPILLMTIEAMVALWLSSWFAEQEVQGSVPGHAATISEIGYFLLPSRDMAERSLKRRKSSKQLTNLWQLFKVTYIL